MIILACNTCSYVSKPTKNESHNVNQANFNARKAHAPPPTAMVCGEVPDTSHNFSTMDGP